ncbi:MAG: hypothetical protein QF639_01680 [Rhodospirillales bacterium]|jgi:hypothetical protein|nr:hypothetical protein [Rhodospirillales bacterium]
MADHLALAASRAVSNRGCDMSGSLLFQDHGPSLFASGVFALGLVVGFSFGILAVLLAA